MYILYREKKYNIIVYLKHFKNEEVGRGVNIGMDISLTRIEDGLLGRGKPKNMANLMRRMEECVMFNMVSRMEGGALGVR